MSVSADEELQTLGIAALLFGLAFVAQRAGFSLALGSFLLGTIVAETPHRNQVERTFEGMRDIFSAVFFVAIGMQFDPAQMFAEAGLVAGIALFVLIARPLACSAALVIVGKSPTTALRTGLMVTPIGEFSFIIAQLGVGAAVIPSRFYALAVGVSLLTTLIAPIVTRQSETIAAFVLSGRPRWFEAWTSHYQDWLERLRARQRRNLLWQLSRKRFAQVGVEMLLVSGVMIFSEQMLMAVVDWLGRDWLFPHGPEVAFWSILCLVLVAPLVAIWRNLSALSLLYAQVAASGGARTGKYAPAIETGLKSIAVIVLVLWLALLLPTEGMAKWLLPASALIVVGAVLLLRQRLVYWHSQLEVELQSVMSSGEHKMSSASAPWLKPHGEWDLHMVDCVVPDLADVQGKKIRDLGLRAQSGCSIVGIERQGYMISLPSPEEAIYPRDRVLLLGTTAQVKAGKTLLSTVSGTAGIDSVFEEVQMESLSVPRWSRAAGSTLAEISPAQKFGVQIAGIHRGDSRILNPAADEKLAALDEVLALGAPDQIREFKTWLQEQPDESDKIPNS